MNYRNLRGLLNAGASRLVLSIEGEGADTGGAGGADDAGGGEAGGDEGAGGDDAGGEAGGDDGAAGGEGGGDPPAAEAGGETPPAKPARVPWHTKRIGQLTGETRQAQEEAAAARREAEEARRQVAAYQALYGTDGVPAAAPAAAPAASPAPAAAAPASGRTYTAEEFQAAVADQARLQTLNQTLEGWYAQGVEKGGDKFKADIAAAGQAFPQLGQRRDLWEALAALPNGGDVYATLAGDLDHLAEVLEMPPVQLGMELAKQSAALAKPASRGAAPPISRAPKPPATVEGQGGSQFDPDTAGMDDYYKDFERRRQARYEARD